MSFFKYSVWNGVLLSLQIFLVVVFTVLDVFWLLLGTGLLLDKYPTNASKVGAFVHVVPAAVWFLLGCLQLIPGIRRNYPKFHRWNGWLLVFTSTISAIGVLIMAISGKCQAGLTGSTAGILGSIAWIYLNYKGIKAGIEKRIEEHSYWMTLSFTFSVSIIWIRVAFLIESFILPNMDNQDGLASVLYFVPLVLVFITMMWLSYDRKSLLGNYAGFQWRNPIQEYKDVAIKTEGFVKCTLEERVKISETMFLLRLRFPAGIDTLVVPPGQHCILKVSIPSERFPVYRPYSPVDAFLKNTPKGCIDFIVKKMPKGLMSDYLCTKIEIGGTIELNGPDGSFDLRSSPAEKPSTLVLLAGGSGITPMLPIIESVGESFKSGSDRFSKVLLVHLVSKPEDNILMTELEQAKVRYEGFFDFEIKQDRKGFNAQRLSEMTNVTLVVCGPLGMMKAYASRAGIPRKQIALLGYDDS